MLLEQGDMQRQFELTKKEKRWLDAVRYRDILKSQNEEDSKFLFHGNRIVKEV